jgi:hypothetical protein
MKILLLSSLLLISICSNAQNWGQITDFTGSARDDGTSFKIGNKVYCGTGRNAGFNVTSDFKAFDLITETWTPIASMPDERQYATSWTYNGEGYVFGGINGAGEFLNDLWKYSPGSDQWSYVDSMPTIGRSAASSFLIGSKVYIVGGNNSTIQTEYDCWEFDLSSLTWTEKNLLPNNGMWRGVTFTNDTTGYIGLGIDVFDSINADFYRYLPTIDQWEIVPQLVTNPRSYVSYAQIGDSVYFYGGVDTNGLYVNSFERIEIPSLSIVNLAPFPATSRKGCIAFASNTDFYITTGITTTARLKETWVARNVVGIEENIEPDVKVFQNGTQLVVKSELNWERIELLSTSGQLIQSREMEEVIELTGIPAGIYLYRLQFDGVIVVGRVYLRTE